MDYHLNDQNIPFDMDEFSLIIVPPQEVTNAVLISTNVAESEYPLWNSSTAYTIGQRVHLVTTHKVYEAVTANTNKQPDISTADWVVVGPTNRWAVFDGAINSQTKQATSIVYELRFPRAVRWVQVLNLTNATSIRVQGVSASDGSVYDKTISLRPLSIAPSWWQWLFGQKFAPTQAAFNDLPVNPDITLTVTITGGADLAVGTLLFGVPEYYTLGVQYGASVGIQDYSRKERTEFGDIVVVPRAFSKRANFTMMAEKAEVDAINNTMARIRATPCLWVGSSAYESMTIYGFWKSFDILIDYPDYSVFQLELEGLI